MINSNFTGWQNVLMNVDGVKSKMSISKITDISYTHIHRIFIFLREYGYTTEKVHGRNKLTLLTKKGEVAQKNLLFINGSMKK